MNKKFNFTEEQKSEIKRLYLIGNLRHIDIAKIFNCNHWNITRILNIMGVHKSRKETNGTKINVPQEIEKEVIKLYYNNPRISQIKVSKKFNLKRWTVKRILKDNNITIHTPEEIARKYEYDTTFLDNIDTKAKAIFLGLFFSDGTNHKNGITIALQEKDKDYLNYFNKLIFKNKKLYISNSAFKKGYQKTYILRIEDKNFSELMNKYGAPPRKSLILEWPNNLSKNLILSFIQGYFEGDGCISKQTQFFKRRIGNKLHISKGTYYRVQILGTASFLTKMQEILNKYNIKTKIEKTSCKIYVLRMNKQKDVMNFGKLIYEDSPIIMQRKFNIFKNLEEDFKNKSFCRKIETIDILAQEC